MSLQATTAVWSYLRWRASDTPEGVGDPLPAAAALVLLFLADRHHSKDGCCYASEGEIATLTGLSRSTVNRALRGYADEWKDRHLLEITFRNGARPSFLWQQACSENAQVYNEDESKPVAEKHSTCSENAQVLPKPVAEKHTTQDLQDLHGNNKRASKPRTPRRTHPLPATRPNAERLLAIIVRGLGDAWGSEPVVNGKREKVLTQLDDLLTAKDFDEVEALYADKLVDAASDPYRRAALRDVVTVASVDGYNALLAVKPKAGRPWQPGDELPHWTDEFPDMALRAMPQAEHDRREREWQERKRNR